MESISFDELVTSVAGAMLSLPSQDKVNIMATIRQVITITTVDPNAPPQYTGAETIPDLVIGQPRQLEGFDPDGDPLTWRLVSPSPLGTLTPDGVFTPTAEGSGQIEVEIDDGK